jgi:hypothetical protein
MNVNTAKVHFHHLFSSDFEKLINKVDAFIQFYTNVHQQYIKTIALDDNTWSQGEKDLASQTFEHMIAQMNQIQINLYSQLNSLKGGL